MKKASRRWKWFLSSWSSWSRTPSRSILLLASVLTLSLQRVFCFLVEENDWLPGNEFLLSRSGLLRHFPSSLKVDASSSRRGKRKLRTLLFFALALFSSEDESDVDTQSLRVNRRGREIDIRDKPFLSLSFFSRSRVDVEKHTFRRSKKPPLVSESNNLEHHAFQQASFSDLSGLIFHCRSFPADHRQCRSSTRETM